MLRVWCHSQKGTVQTREFDCPQFSELQLTTPASDDNNSDIEYVFKTK